MYIIKASGKKEKFSPAKVHRTCIRAGADKLLADQIVTKIKKEVYNGISSQKILRLILRYLRQRNPIVAARYGLKEAMLGLGPGGFIFEKFIVRLLKAYDCRAWCPPIISGACVKHEVDIIAKTFSDSNFYLPKNRHEIVYMIECKYHNAPGIRCGLKNVLYVWARFLDLNDAAKLGLTKKFDCAWLVSNTKFSQSATQYAKCKKMRLLGWKYPPKNGLERLIEDKKLYPITILRTLDADSRAKLFSKNYILCQDIISTKRNVLQKKTRIKSKNLTTLINEAIKVLNQH